MDDKSEKGLFIDIFPADRYHIGKWNFFFERTIKTYNKFVCKCLDSVNYKHLSSEKKILAFFHPVFEFLLRRYLNVARKLINRNRNLGDDCYIGHGFDTLWKRFFKYSDMMPLIELEFEGSLFFAPHSPDVYLTTLYGKNYMTPPPEAKRQAAQHAHAINPTLQDVV
jgi:lipopolysaccharide cholinephosphotransferase